MFRIGDFSRLSRVSIKTLHHYDELGLFRAATVDPFTGYRYYTFDQMPRLNRILVLRGLGFSLAQIMTYLEEGHEGEPNPKALREMLETRRLQLQAEIYAAQEKLVQVEMRLTLIEQEGKMPHIEVAVKSVDAITLVGAREIVHDVADMRERCMALNAKAYAPIAAKAVTSDGISLALYHPTNEQGIDVEMAYVVEPPSTDVVLEEAQLHALAPSLVAYATYHGSYDDFAAVGQVHHALNQWIQASTYRVSGATREYYLRPPQSSENSMGIMEMQYPLEPK